MLKLRVNINFDDCKCDVLFEDVTNFSASNGADGRFLPESATPTETDYRLSDGVFLNIVYSKDYNDDIVIFPTDYIPNAIPSDYVNPDYSKNVKPTKQQLLTDGKIFVSRHFVVTRDFYNDYGENFNVDIPIYIYDTEEAQLYIIREGEEFAITYTDLVRNLKPGSQGISSITKVLFSVCKLRQCYSAMLQEQFDKLLGNDPIKTSKNCFNGDCREDVELTNLKRNIDLLRNALASIDYLLQCGHYDDAMRLLNLLGKCGGICFKYNKNNKYGCGC